MKRQKQSLSLTKRTDDAMLAFAQSTIDDSSVAVLWRPPHRSPDDIAPLRPSFLDRTQYFQSFPIASAGMLQALTM